MAVKKSIVKGINAVAALQAAADAAVQPVAAVKKQAVAKVEVTHADGTTETAEEAVGKPSFYTSPPFTVHIGARLKIQLEKFKTYAECSVEITAPCTAGELDEMADFAQNWVDERMAALHAKLDAATVPS